MTCKTWTIPAEYFLGLCNMQFQPVVGQASCPVCVVPVLVEE